MLAAASTMSGNLFKESPRSEAFAVLEFRAGPGGTDPPIVQQA